MASGGTRLDRHREPSRRKRKWIAESTNRWRIVLNGNVASVTSTSGTGDSQTATFSVERTTQGLLLIHADRPPGASSQIITIDTSNGSFVYSDQHTNPLWNRATVFFGACQPTT